MSSLREETTREEFEKYRDGDITLEQLKQYLENVKDSLH